MSAGGRAVGRGGRLLLIDWRVFPAESTEIRSGGNGTGHGWLPWPVGRRGGRGQLSMLMDSPPLAVPAASQAIRETLLRTNRTLPSHMAAFTPPVCWLRASCIRARDEVEVVVHGGCCVLPHEPPVITSVALALFGVW